MFFFTSLRLNIFMFPPQTPQSADHDYENCYRRDFFVLEGKTIYRIARYIELLNSEEKHSSANQLLNLLVKSFQCDIMLVALCFKSLAL